MAGKNAARRGRLFDLYVRQPGHKELTQGRFFWCPLCRRPFERAATVGDNPQLTLAHIIQKSLGGTWTTLACADCNNGHGHKIEDARRFSERLIFRYPNKGEAWGELGYTYWQLRGQHETDELSRKAITAFSKAIELGFFDQGLIPDRLGHLYLDRGECDKAEAAFRVAAEHDPTSYGYCLGLSLLELGRYEEALHWLLEAADKHQPDALSWGNVAFCYDKMGKRPEAIVAYRKAIDIDPSCAIGWFNL